MDWYRCYHGMPNDAKLRLVAKRCGLPTGNVVAIWAWLMDMASQCPDRGSVEDFDPEIVALAYDYRAEDVQNAYKTLCNAGLVSEGNRLVSWERRQPKREDRSTDRVRKHRAEKKQKSNHETHETFGETLKPPRAEQSKAENKSAQAREGDASHLGKTKRRPTDAERDLAAKATGTVPWECTDADVEGWRRTIARREAMKVPKVVSLPVPEAPKPPAEPDGMPDIPPLLDRRQA